MLLRSLLCHLASRSELCRLYHENFIQQLESGIIERAPCTSSGPIVHYIPHQPVWNEVKRKLRVVYDASASAPRGQALNDNLLRGPVFLPDLVGRLLRLRSTAIAVVADVQQAFLQVHLNEPDRDVTRFLWVEHPELPIGPSNPLVTYRFQRIFFGAISSPFLLAATILHHLRTSNSRWATRIAENTYVDNVLLTSETTEEAKEACKEAKRLFGEACMNLRDFQSNDSEVNEAVAPDDRHGSFQIKVLGLHWDSMKDTLAVETKPLPTGPLKKRNLLRFIARHYDPLGYMAPAILPLKILLQEVTKECPNWDMEAPPEQRRRWDTLLTSWNTVRYVMPRATPQRPLELHTFVDASTKAYAAVVYLRGGNGTTLLYAKSRLCPIKGLTIPRLELLAATIGTRINDFIVTQLHLEGIPRTIWSDSRCVLAWIKAPIMDKLPRFVRNRLEEIHKQKGLNFAYVPTEANPADIAIRGLTPQELISLKEWWHGPTWLSEDKNAWPNQLAPAEPHFCEENEENSEVICAAPTLSEETSEMTFFLIEATRFSSWSKLLESTTCALRAIRKMVKTKPVWLNGISSSGPLCANDRLIAFRCLIKQAQTGSVSKQDISRWELKKDEQELWRCGGRLTETTLPRSEKYPIFLSRRPPITYLLILKEHSALFHGGTPSTLTRLRQKFWIPRGRRTVKAVISASCASCRRWNAKPFALPHMPPLPMTRVQPAPAFSYTGVDLLGPVRIQSDRKMDKRWLTLFTCLVTRAVHLEVAKDLSAFAFIDAFRRFITRRGLPQHMLSDNGTNLVLTAKALKAIPETRTMTWNFITAMAPWKGGVYERIIGMTKTCLKRTIGRRLLTDSELRTLTVEVEAVLNERPLTYVENENLTVLRPIDYLQPKAHLAVQIHTPDEADPSFEPKPPTTRTQLIEQWSRAQACRDNFWKLWQHEYLHLLRERSQRYHHGPHAQTRRPPRIGEVVLLHDDNAPRGTWRLARITAVKTGADNMVRTARVKTSTGRLLDRTVAQLYPLEVDENKAEVDDPSGSSDSSGMADQHACTRNVSLTTNHAVVISTENAHQTGTMN